MFTAGKLPSSLQDLYDTSVDLESVKDSDDSDTKFDAISKQEFDNEPIDIDMDLRETDCEDQDDDDM